MADNVTNELMYETLKAIRGDLSQIKADMRDLKEGQISIREEFRQCVVMHCVRSAPLHRFR